MIIEIFQSPKNKQYFFRLKARNGRIIAQSEGYKAKQSVTKLIRSGFGRPQVCGTYDVQSIGVKDLTK